VSLMPRLMVMPDTSMEDMDTLDLGMDEDIMEGMDMELVLDTMADMDMAEVLDTGAIMEDIILASVLLMLNPKLMPMLMLDTCMEDMDVVCMDTPD